MGLWKGQCCPGRWGGQRCLGLSVKAKSEYLGQKFVILLTDDESITENKSMSGNKYESNGLAFISEHLRNANDLKRHNRRDLKGKWQYQIYSQFSSASIRIKSEKWRQIPANKEHGNGSVACQGDKPLVCTHYLLLLLTGILFHVTRPESLCRNWYQHRTGERLQVASPVCWAKS